MILDTNIIIDHLRKTDDQKSHLMKIVEDVNLDDLAISIISLQELYEGTSTKDKQKEKFLLDTIRPFKILPYSEDVAILAGKVARDLNRPIELADAAIAATAIIAKSPLRTLNKKDFINIEQLKLI